MKVYEVEITTHAYVAAESRSEAHKLATMYATNILEDDGDPDIQCSPEPLTKLSQLGYGWTGDCLIYGTSADVKIGTLLEGIEA